MWHYRACKKGKVFYVVEYFPTVKGRPYSENPEWAFGDSKKELIQDLEYMLHDVKKYRVLIDKEGKSNA